ncbi:MAG: prenyltransferase [Halanaerobiales bacterium]
MNTGINTVPNNKLLKNKGTLLKDIWRAARPLSLTLALYSTTIGMVIAYQEGKLFIGELAFDIWLIFLVTVAGVAVQTATNFINDYFECEIEYVSHSSQGEKTHYFLGKKRSSFDILIFILGISCFAITGIIGIYLTYLTTTKLLVIGIIGLIGGYSYTGEPIVYKKKGLGTPLSFLLVGPLMVYGSYLVFTEQFSWSPIILGMPVGLMIPMMMLSNEIRDYERDKEWGIRTMTVRLGYKTGKYLYLGLLIASYVLILLYVLLGWMPLAALLTFVTIPLAVKAFKNVSKSRKEGVPITNKLHLSFGLITILALLFG